MISLCQNIDVTFLYFWLRVFLFASTCITVVIQQKQHHHSFLERSFNLKNIFAAIVPAIVYLYTCTNILHSKSGDRKHQYSSHQFVRSIIMHNFILFNYTAQFLDSFRMVRLVYSIHTSKWSNVCKLKVTKRSVISSVYLFSLLLIVRAR